MFFILPLLKTYCRFELDSDIFLGDQIPNLQGVSTIVPFGGRFSAEIKFIADISSNPR